MGSRAIPSRTASYILKYIVIRSYSNVVTGHPQRHFFLLLSTSAVENVNGLCVSVLPSRTNGKRNFPSEILRCSFLMYVDLTLQHHDGKIKTQNFISAVVNLAGQ